MNDWHTLRSETWKPPSSVVVQLPPFASGGLPASLFNESGFAARVEDYSNGVYRLIESPTSAVTSLVQVEKIAGKGVPVPQRERLSDIVRGSDIQYESMISESELTEHLDRLGDLNSPVDLFLRLQFMCISTSNRQFPDAAISAFDALSSMQTEQNSPAYSDTSIHVIVPSSALTLRARTAAFLLRVQADDQLRSGQVSHMQTANDELLFASMQSLHDGLYLLEAYIGPLLGALSPAVWGFSAPRAFGQTLFSLGGTLNGRRPGGAAEPLQMLLTRDRSGTTVFPKLETGACSDAVSWWCFHLDRFLQVVTDPRVFAGSDGAYRPARHLQCLSSIDQVFRLTHAIQTTDRDSVARRVMMHSVIDTLEGLLGYSTETMFDIKFARKILQQLKETMSTRQATLLLHAGQRAVAALEELQEGFFLARQAGRQHIPIPGQSDLPIDTAASHYIKILRNSTHGYGGKPGSSDSTRTETLLANHSGEVPHDLASIAYLYLLYMITNPATVGRSSARRAAR